MPFKSFISNICMPKKCQLFEHNFNSLFVRNGNLSFSAFQPINFSSLSLVPRFLLKFTLLLFFSFILFSSGCANRQKNIVAIIKLPPANGVGSVRMIFYGFWCNVVRMCESIFSPCQTRCGSHLALIRFHILFGQLRMPNWHAIAEM